MNAIIAELHNLASGSAQAGDQLAVKICFDGIGEIKRLQAIVDMSFDMDSKMKEIKRLHNEIEQLQTRLDETKEQRLVLCLVCRQVQVSDSSGRCECGGGLQSLGDGDCQRCLANQTELKRLQAIVDQPCACSLARALDQQLEKRKEGE